MRSDLAWPALQVRYGNYAFNSSVRTTAFSITPEKTADGRATAYARWSIQLEFDVDCPAGAGFSTDAEAMGLIAELLHQGQGFVYQGQGLGNPNINTALLFDMRWGPTTKITSVEILAPQRAVKFGWLIEFCIPHCPERWYDTSPYWYEISYTVTHHVDDAGFTTRTVSGFASMANNRTSPGSTEMLRSPDDYRRDFAGPIPVGFHRKYHPWAISPDRTRLDFGFDDDEMPAIFPNDVVECTMEDGVSSTAEGLVAWQGSINGMYRLRRGANGNIAAAHFLEEIKFICLSRVNELKRLKGLAGRGDRAKFVVCVPTGFTAKNPNRYGKPAANFSFTYTFSCPLGDLFTALGLWQSPGGDHAKWVKSLEGTALNPYGGVNMRFVVGSEKVLDPCYPPAKDGGKIVELTRPDTTPPDDDEPDSDSLADAFPAPDAESSWLRYECDLVFESDTGVVEIKTLPDSEPDPTLGVFGGDSVPTMPSEFQGTVQGQTESVGPSLPVEPQSTARNDTPSNSSNSSTFRRAKPSCVVYLRGFALRVGYPIDPPELLEVGGIVPVEASRPDCGEEFMTGSRASVVHTIYFAAWNLRYILPEVPTGPLRPPVNPLLDN